MRPVYMISGGVRRFVKARPASTVQKMTKEAFDHAVGDVPDLSTEAMIDGSV